MIIHTAYEKELLNGSSLAMVLARFSGQKDLKIKTYSWPVRLWRWLLRKEPEYIYPPLPVSSGNKIKFRRYEPFRVNIKSAEGEAE